MTRSSNGHVSTASHQLNPTPKSKELHDDHQHQRRASIRTAGGRSDPGRHLHLHRQDGGGPRSLHRTQVLARYQAHRAGAVRPRPHQGDGGSGQKDRGALLRASPGRASSPARNSLASATTPSGDLTEVFGTNPTGEDTHESRYRGRLDGGRCCRRMR